MIEIAIDKKLKETARELTLGCISATIKNTDHNEQLWRNTDKLPVFADLKGPFGSRTSDSKRTLIKPESQDILMIIVAFNANREMEHILPQSVNLLKKYAAAENIETRIIG